MAAYEREGTTLNYQKKVKAISKAWKASSFLFTGLGKRHFEGGMGLIFFAADGSREPQDFGGVRVRLVVNVAHPAPSSNPSLSHSESTSDACNLPSHI